MRSFLETSFIAVLLIRMTFSDPDSTFQLVSDAIWFLNFFSNILNMNFTFVFTYRKCVRLHIMTRYELFREIFLSKGILFTNWVYWMRNGLISSFSEWFYFKFILDPELQRSGMILFRICIRIRILVKVSDLTGFGSGSRTLHQRAYFGFQIAAYGLNEELFPKPPVIPEVVLKSPRTC